MMIKVIRKLNAKSWARVAARVKAGRDPVLQIALTQMSRRYEAFTRRRFNAYARGGGDWKPLALSTVEGRRKGKGKVDRSSLARDTRRGGGLVAAGKVVSILINTGLLQQSLSIGTTGNLNILTGRNTIRYGLKPIKVGKGAATLQQIAGYHNAGGSSGNNPPKRVILAAPDQATKDGMTRDVERAVLKIMKEESLK
jgi:hypothetical protein